MHYELFKLKSLCCCRYHLDWFSWLEFSKTGSLTLGRAFLLPVHISLVFSIDLIQAYDWYEKTDLSHRMSPKVNGSEMLSLRRSSNNSWCDFRVEQLSRFLFVDVIDCRCFSVFFDVIDLRRFRPSRLSFDVFVFRDFCLSRLCMGTTKSRGCYSRWLA